MTQRRRSIVDFEKWVDGEIATVESGLNKLEAEVEAARQKRALEEVRLATLRTVKARLAFENTINNLAPIEPAVDATVEAVEEQPALV